MEKQEANGPLVEKTQKVERGQFVRIAWTSRRVFVFTAQELYELSLRLEAERAGGGG